MTRTVRGFAAATALLALPLAGAVPRSAAAPETTRDTTTTRDTVAVGGLPAAVAAEAVRVYNAAATVRARGALTIDAKYEGVGDVAVLNGPLVIAGHVSGRVVAINADVQLEPGARIDGDLLVVGGRVDGRSDASIGGEVRVYHDALFYREDGDRIEVAPDGWASSADDDSGWRRWGRRVERSTSEIRFASARTYNRVEGLPLEIGPTYRRETDWGRVSVDALGIVRTADRLEWSGENLGHRVRAEVRLGGRPGVAVGGQLYDVVNAVEPWQLGDAEVGLAAFFLHRDYRDYYDTHGGEVHAKLVGGDAVSLTLGLADERWSSRETHDPFTLFRNAQGWRPNPRMDEGRFHLAKASFALDTRNRPLRPWSGWYATVEFEHGVGQEVAGAYPIDLMRSSLPAPRPTVAYNRGFVDVRRYNRLAPNAQLNMRVVLGAQLGGDDLPLQRRFSVGGPGTLPGYDFRSLVGPTDVAQCNAGGVAGAPFGPAFGAPALCQRMALVQLEYRGDLRYNVGFDDSDRAVRYWRDAGGAWVIFADAGRGWLLGRRDGGLTYGRGELPAPSSFRTDVGLGLDFTNLGLYVAKATSDLKEPANFLVRVRRRI
jgi:hypothetical protein